MVTLPDWLFQTTWIYHITAIDNLRSVLEAGQLHSTNNKPANHTSIANADIQSRRATQPVELGPGGVIHDYVPFYFAPRSPMLCANYQGNLANPKPQDEIIYLGTTAQRIHNAGLPYVFYDRHAITAYAECYDNIENLDKIDWELFFEPPLLGEYAKFWQDKDDPRNPRWLDRKAVRQAEFLVYQTLDWQNIDFIGTMNEARTNQVSALLTEFGDQTPVDTRSDWYF